MGGPTYHAAEMAWRGLRLILLLAVLVQCAPMRVCALERVAVGSSCHEWTAEAALERAHADEQQCGAPTDGGHDCICERPKVVVQHNPQAVKSPLDWANLSLVLVDPVAGPAMAIPALPDPDPDRGAPVAQQFPLLI